MSLVAIITALAGISLHVNGEAITAWDAEDMKNRLNSADLPIRMFQPLSAGSPGRGTTARTLGSNKERIDWKIVDLMLWKPVGSGEQLGQFMPALLAYVDDYRSGVSRSTLGIAGVRVNEYQFDPSTFPFGDDRTRYYGVEVILNITELT